MERYNITTRVWEVMLLCKYGSMYLIQLKDIKDSNPFKVAQYSVSDCKQYKPVFLGGFLRY